MIYKLSKIIYSKIW